MTVYANETWINPLLSLANEAWLAVHPAENKVNKDQVLLEQAYAHCEAVTADHSRSFYLASGLMKPDIRRAVRALYAFCRTTDDIVDETGSQASAVLSLWRERSLSWHPPEHDLVAVAWADARARYNVPQRLAEQLIDGVARDLYQDRYNSFEDLSTYCYGVASTVGLMSMHISGYESEEAVPYAIKLGVALQLTNILRDVAEDWQRGRLYLPQDELELFSLGSGDLDRGVEEGVYDDRWRQFMKFQIGRARQIYEDSWPGIALLGPNGRFAIAAAATFYRHILEDIEAHDYDVFSRRAHVSTWGKLRRIPSIWWRTRS
ncbi:MAG: squalene/phytoene synthase family protein [Candidatus Promineifilaceae bacterium]|nr:squalene/phytoene synthase family protein [Candidatus Promineifilaceae bacterium]